MCHQRVFHLGSIALEKWTAVRQDLAWQLPHCGTSAKPPTRGPGSRAAELAHDLSGSGGQCTWCLLIGHPSDSRDKQHQPWEAPGATRLLTVVIQ